MIGEKNKTVILPIIAKNGRSHQIFVNLEQIKLILSQINTKWTEDTNQFQQVKTFPVTKIMIRESYTDTPEGAVKLNLIYPTFK